MTLVWKEYTHYMSSTCPGDGRHPTDPIRALVHSHKFSGDIPAAVQSESFIERKPQNIANFQKQGEKNPVSMFVPSKIMAITQKASFKV